ncbi:hypothetical protein A2960_00935 [Candidatus Gottesmanbacteria bacterium RIFCSPLOWO2_01_FULL_39_12b]|uniref:NAD(P)-binding domain-containing protein n=1 Tax=Candidatus Gottesmanbacteria bacterium RIFCSPLOWO2_01_FULL_39_12b TaxID=1798388 RepID=A0A1F6APW0_9BACT|nr:MAG: hypothetical protein A2960_00935 [Candidatus Gottesmanbacteria bacterium RIFCSPLOWO2_01_FULL_39_12b]
MKILITGISGFVGYWLSYDLMKKGHEVFGLSRKKNNSLPKKIVQYQSDITDSKLVNNIIQEVSPGSIYHLSSQSNIPYSIIHPQETMQINVNGTLNLLEAIRISKRKIKLFSFGSSSEYGKNSLTNKSFSEDSALYPSNPYGVSKVAQGHLVSIYKRLYLLPAYHLRPFAIIGPGKNGDAVSDFASRIVTIERGLEKYLPVGNLTSFRDFIDIRDFVNALNIISKNGNSYDVYNICSGRGRQLKEVLAIMIKMAKVKIPVRYDKSRYRAYDDNYLVGDPKRLNLLGFEPKYSITQSLENIMEFWRKNHG